MVFLSEEGLTSTSANHIANMAKEYIQNAELFINGMDFINTTLSVLGKEGEVQTKFGCTKEKFDKIPETLGQIAQANSLIAWLREGIKAKENLLKEINDMTLSEYADKTGEILPEVPMAEEDMTVDDYIATWDIKKRNLYYSLETLASTIGVYIHPNGRGFRNKEIIKKILASPVTTEERGGEILVYTSSASISMEEVDNMFFKLQNKHREVQAQLNSLKYEVENAVNTANIQKHSVYREKIMDYNQRMRELEAQFSLYKKEQSAYVGNLKIVIPDNLKPFYNMINSLGK